MCGIVGCYNPSGTIARSELEAAAQRLQHRGPDASGCYVGPGIGLAHRRLAIIDLRPDANQPHWNEDHTIAVVCNGMIYNYRELRAELIGRGHRFASETDTEVIPHLYEEEGPDCVRRLRGLFALAIWDEPRRQLLLARDHVGQKPLLYAQRGGRWYFASEAKALWCFGELSPELDPLGVHGYLTFGLPPWSQTIYRGVRRLPPATSLLIQNGQATEHVYWTPPVNAKRRVSMPGLCGELRATLTDAVARCAISDVPVGVMLSGGLDSSSVVGLLRQHDPARSIETFSVGVETHGAPDPDLAAARAVAAACRTHHHELQLTPQCFDALPRMLWHYDEPYAKPNALANFLLCRMARRHVTVALSGDGGDEVFGGYSGYQRWAWFELAARALRAVGIGSSPSNGFQDSRPVSWLSLLMAEPASRRSIRKRMEMRPLMTRLYSDEFLASIQHHDLPETLRVFYEQLNPQHFLDGVLFQDLMLQTSHGTCVLSDITGMASGLEIRSPYLDRLVVEFAASLPPPMKVGWNRGKAILRRTMASALPSSVLTRRKMGYGEPMPFERWFRHEWRSRVEEALFGGSLQSLGLFQPRAIEQLYAEYRVGATHHFEWLWALVCLGVWHQTCFQSASTTAASEVSA